MAAPQMFTIRISFNADGLDTAERLSAAFRKDGPYLAPGTVSIRADDGYVTVEFERVSDDPTMGPTSVGHKTPGAEIVAAMEGFSHEHSVVVPVLRALLTVTAMRELAGLPPRRELRIDVVPAEPLPQDSVSTHRSESAHSPPARFGG